jgi:hypothetical protein
MDDRDAVEHATSHGFTCVDLYHAFNGATGDQAIGNLAIDGTHPSQAGNDLIASLLDKVDVEVLTRAG